MTDLQERFTQFAQASIAFSRSLPGDTVTRPLVSQFVRASTSVGANYMEAQNCISRKDFRNKIYICKKEAQEAKYWLMLLESSRGEHGSIWKELSQEALEITLILQSIANKLAPPLSEKRP